MPPRRPHRGRHRKPKRNNGPAYVTAATLAAFTVSGLNVPGAIGDARSESSVSARRRSSSSRPRTVAADQLRQTLVKQQEQRASRTADRDHVLGRASSRRLAKKERAAREAARPKWVVPVLGYRLTAGFGDYGLWSRSHTGQDFAAPYGTPVHAVGDGKIIFAALRRRLRQQDRDPAPRRHRHLVRPHVGVPQDQRHRSRPATSSAGSAPPATPPARTCTSRSGPATAARCRR